MRDTPKHFTAPRLAIWTSAPASTPSGTPGCAVFVSFATSRLRIDVDRLANGLIERGLRFEGLTRSNAHAVPPGLLGVVETSWDGGDPVDAILALLGGSEPRTARRRPAERQPSPTAV